MRKDGNGQSSTCSEAPHENQFQEDQASRFEMIASKGEEREPREVIPRSIGEEPIVIKRAFQIKREDVLREGVTPNCPGCARAITAGTARNHTLKCRDV